MKRNYQPSNSQQQTYDAITQLSPLYQHLRVRQDAAALAGTGPPVLGIHDPDSPDAD